MSWTAESCGWDECTTPPRSGRFCDTHRPMHAQRLRADVERMVGQHRRRLDAHAAAAAEGLAGWDAFCRGEDIHRTREASAVLIEQSEETK